MTITVIVSELSKERSKEGREERRKGEKNGGRMGGRKGGRESERKKGREKYWDHLQKKCYLKRFQKKYWKIGVPTHLDQSILISSRIVSAKIGVFLHVLGYQFYSDYPSDKSRKMQIVYNLLNNMITHYESPYSRMNPHTLDRRKAVIEIHDLKIMLKKTLTQYDNLVITNNIQLVYVFKNISI